MPAVLLSRVTPRYSWINVMQLFKACIARPSSKPMIGFYEVFSETEKTALNDLRRAVPDARQIDFVRHDRLAARVDVFLPGEVRQLA